MSQPRKLTPEQIRAIQRRYRPYKVTYKQLAQQFGVSKSVVQYAVKNIKTDES